MLITDTARVCAQQRESTNLPLGKHFHQQTTFNKNAALLLPLDRTLFQFVNESKNKNEEEEEHGK